MSNAFKRRQKIDKKNYGWRKRKGNQAFTKKTNDGTESKVGFLFLRRIFFCLDSSVSLFLICNFFLFTIHYQLISEWIQVVSNSSGSFLSGLQNPRPNIGWVVCFLDLHLQLWSYFLLFPRFNLLCSLLSLFIFF